ncbi:S4 domain-containing protein, partial [Vibrio alfacsensis]
MRLDKFLCDALGATRKEATKIIKSGDVTVDGVVQKSGAF